MTKREWSCTVKQLASNTSYNKQWKEEEEMEGVRRRHQLYKKSHPDNNKVVFKTPMVVQLVKKYPAFCGTRRLITVPT